MALHIVVALTLSLLSATPVGRSVSFLYNENAFGGVPRDKFIAALNA